MNKVLSVVLVLSGLFLFTFSGSAQNITLAQVSGGVAASPLPSNGINQAILGFSLAKAGGGAASVSAISVSLTENPTGRFINPRLYKSADNSFGPADLAAVGNPIGTSVFGATSINITGSITDFGGGSGAAGPEYFFMVVDIDNSVNPSTAPITPSLSTSDITVSTTLSVNTITGIAYSFSDVTPPTITFNPTNGSIGFPLANNITITFSDPVRKLDDSPITSGDLATLVELKLTNNAGAAVPFTANIDGTGTIITIDPTADLTGNTLYYIEINPIEDEYGNAIVATNITFTTLDSAPPVITFNPIDGATGIVETANIIISFDEAVRLISNATITPSDILSLVELRVNDAAGALVPFTGSINGGNTIITINPTPVLAGNTVYYVKINPVEDISNNATTTTSITFTTGDTLPPNVTYSPAGGSNNASVVGNIVLTFSEPIRKLDDTPVTQSDIEGGLIELKITNNGGADVPFTGTINVSGTVITIDPNATLLPNQVYYVEVNPIEDASNNASSAQNITFTTENIPSITNFTPSGGTCIGDNITVTGLRFTGTGNPSAGNTLPTVTIDGVALVGADIVSFNQTQVVFKVPATATSGPITIRNNDSGLVSANSSTLNVFPAIDTSLPVTPSTVNPPQNTSVVFSVATTQSSFNYSLIANSTPGGYTATTQNTSGDGGTKNLTTSPSLTVIGDYTYRIDVSRTGCTTKTLASTPITVTVADLTLSVSATNTNICSGNSTTLIAAASGGTGFYQFRWTSTPAGFSSGSSSPTVFPTGNTTYHLEVEDNSGNTKTGFVDIVVNPVPAPDIVPAPGQSTVQTNYNIENTNYQLYGSPAGGVFSGNGVILNAGIYYFNPSIAGVGIHPITYTYTDGQSCAASDTETFEVKTSAISGLDVVYCQNTASDSPLAPNTYNYGTYQFTRLVFYAYNFTTGIYCIAEPAPSFPYCGVGKPNPLTVNSYQNVLSNQAGISLPFGATFLQPASYSINLNAIRNNYGFSDTGSFTDYYFYILIYVKDQFGTEYFWDAQKMEVLRNQPSPFIVGIKADEAICSNLPSIALSSSETGYGVTGYSIFPAAFSSSVNSGAGLFNPADGSLAGADSRDLTLTMAYNDKNNCPNTVNTNFKWVKKPSAPLANDTTYCAFTGLGTKPPYFIKANGNGEVDRYLWYEFDPVANPLTPDIGNGGPLFSPKNIDGLSAVTDQYFVVQSNFGCKGDFDAVTIEIKAAPNAIFTNTNICEDREFELTGPKDGATPYPLYEWDFGDTNFESIPNDNLNTYNYGPGTANRPFPLKLIVTNSNGCTNEFSKTVIVGQNPKPDFSVDFICDGDNSVFTATSDITVAEFSWDFGDGTTIAKNAAVNPAPEGGTVQNPIHNFSLGPDEYDVTITSYTASGCNNPITKKITILHYLTRDTDSPYKMMDSEDAGKGFWRLTDESLNGNSTWDFALPTSDVKKKIGTAAWVTNPSGNYASNEISFLNSPCLNIQDIVRPVISMDMILNTQENSDGLVLEYSSDNGVNWSPLGGINSGLNWFNTSGFFGGNIGSSSIGWSGDSWKLEDNTSADTVIQARRALDDIPNRNKVRFRFAFQTNAERELDGIAINNLSISSRDKISLVENFTNESATNYSSNNAAFKNPLIIPLDETARIQYHVSYPDEDVNGSANKADPASRAAYYGIPMVSQYIPRGYVDGVSEGLLSDGAGNWVKTRLSKQSLKNADYNLKIESVASTDITYFKLKATVEAKVNIPANRNHILHIAIVEKTVGNNEFVLRKLIRDANGKVLPEMNLSDTHVIIDSLQLENKQINVDQLALVAFIQDQSTREVYQASFDLSPLFKPTLITGIEQLFSEQVNIYPNPASREFRVELPTLVPTDVSMFMIDQVGRKHQSGLISSGTNIATVNVENLSDGIYILEIGTSNTGIIRKKIMVVRN